MGGSSSGKTYAVTQHTTVLRYAPYIETYQNNILTSYSDKVTQGLTYNPFEEHEDIDLDSAYFVIGNSIINYSIVCDLFNTFMYDVDVNVAFSDSFDKLVSKENDIEILAKVQVDLNDKVELHDLYKLSDEARKINATNSSTFIINKAVIERKRSKELNDISLQLSKSKLKQINEDINDKLNHTRSVIVDYMEMVRSYFEVKVPIETNNFDYLAQKYLWPFTLLDQQKRAVAIMEVPNNIDLSAPRQVAKRKTSTVGKVMNVATGFYYGWTWGAKIGSYWGPVGTVVGAVIGAIVGGIAGYLLS